MRARKPGFSDLCLGEFGQDLSAQVVVDFNLDHHCRGDLVKGERLPGDYLQHHVDRTVMADDQNALTRVAPNDLGQGAFQPPVHCAEAFAAAPGRDPPAESHFLDHGKPGKLPGKARAFLFAEVIFHQAGIRRRVFLDHLCNRLRRLHGSTGRTGIKGVKAPATQCLGRKVNLLLSSLGEGGIQVPVRNPLFHP